MGVLQLLLETVFLIQMVALQQLSDIKLHVV
jgi:hypothetical protein